MEDQKRINSAEAFNIAQSFPIEPMFNKVIVTLNKEEVDHYLVLSDNVMSEEQYVVAFGSHVHNITLGDKVLLDIEKMMTKERNPENQDEYITRIKIDPITVDGHMYALIEDRFIKAKYKN
jgi:hypothetical protein